MVDLVPVDHQPEFDEADQSAMMPETFVPPMLVDWAKQAAPKDLAIIKGAGKAAEDLATLPKRAIENSQFSVGTGTYDPRVPIEAALTAMSGGVGGTGEKAAGEVLGSGPARMRMIDNVDLYKELANQNRAKGFSTGKSAAGWDTKRPDAAKGSWEDLVARTKAGWEGDKARAINEYEKAAPGAQARSPLMTDEDYSVAGDPSFSRATFGSGATDKKTAALVQAIKGGLDMSQEGRMARAAEQGYEGPWYHGGLRMDRFTGTGKIDPKRATSGPMPYFTDDPEMASSYAMGKKPDTSLEDTGQTANYFTVSPKDLGISGRSPLTVEQSWHFLPPDVKQTILNNMKRVGFQDKEMGEGPFVLHPEGTNGSIAGDQHWDHVLNRESRGNPLTALRDVWHDSGTLINDPGQLSEIYRLAGYPHPISEASAPWTEARGVFPGMLKMTNPLDTTDANMLREKVLPALEQEFKSDRSRKAPYGVDMWDKNYRYTPKEWVQQAKEDLEKGENSYVWTSIPDKVTAALRKQGYDGILDTGGKGGGTGHTVAIPFGPEQVRSTFAKFDPKNEGKSMLLGSGATDKQNAALLQAIRAYHGSPHDFDRFDMSKIGTGEGAQAYGHGLYFAEAEPTAKAYRDALAPGYRPTLNGTPFADLPEGHRTVAQWIANTGAHPDEIAKISEQRGLKTIQEAKDLGMGDIGDVVAKKHFDTAKAAREISTGGKWDIGQAPNGRMYEVNINADPEHFLDWDKPLSQQHPKVQEALRLGELPQKPTPDEANAVFALAKQRGVPASQLPEYQELQRRLDSANSDAWQKFGINPSNVHTRPEDLTGGQFVQGLEQKMLGPDVYGGKSPAASQTLRDAGIPGIKYLDQGSRGAGEGSRNYVVFRDDIIDIIKKYGLAGVAALPPSIQEMAQQMLAPTERPPTK